MQDQRLSVVLGSLLASLVLMATPTAQACSPMKVIGVYFDRDSATVSAAQVSGLANWMADLRARYPNHESIDVSASAEPGEQAPNSLAIERARNVARVLRENLQFDETKIYLPDQGYVKKPASAYLKQLEKSQGVRAVQLDFLPASPHECSCQMSAHLHKPRVPQ
ncbi:hypothetical protein NWF24_27220 [Variovorax paradoxus]|uniref:hypothetical protein n=1 Tax=Variovorax paradoxus TaxID=34073 RepID=UPI0021ACC082|nr:hypothetical protein [Variovorax paradoxus]UVH56504.1 hypothetical protein NWF24_27220 [Variovorax paradoxus]